MTIEFTMTREDVQEARLVHFRSQRGVVRGRWPIVALVVLVVLCAAGPEFARARLGVDVEAYTVIGSVAVLLVVPVVAIVAWARSPKQFEPIIDRSVLADSRGSGSRWVFDANDVIAERGRRRMQMKWTAVRRAVESENLFLIYIGDREFGLLPKRAFTPEQLEQFRQLLSENVSGPTAAFPVVLRGNSIK